MSTLWRKSFRDLVKARWQVVGLTLLVALVVAQLVGSVRARRMLAHSRDACLARLGAADLDIRCSPTQRGALAPIDGEPGLAEAEERMLLDGVLRVEGQPVTPAVVRMLPRGARPRIYALDVVEGRWPAPDEKALLVDRSTASVRGIEVGDEVRLEVLDTDQRLPVVGVVLDSEHLTHPAHPEFAFPIPGALAAVHASAAAAEGIPNADLVDSLVFRFKPGSDPAEVQKRLLERLEVSILGVLTGEANPTRRATAIVVSVYRIYMPTVVFLLVAIAAALFVITIARLVHRQRAQIGSLLALGQRRRAIAFSLIGFSVLPAAVGWVLGVLVHPIIAHLIFDSRFNSVGWPPLDDPGLGLEALWTAIACIGLGVMACLLPALWTTLRMPARLLRHDARRVWRRPSGPLTRLGLRLRAALHLPLGMLLGLRTILRRRWVSAVTAIALAGNFALVLTYLFVHISHTEEVEATYNRLGLDGVVYFAEPKFADTLGAPVPSTWSRIEPTIAKPAWFEFETGPAFIRLLCLPADSWISEFPMAEGRPFGESESPTVYVDRWIADAHDLEIGDHVTCFPYYSAIDGVEVEVAGILGGVSMGIAAMPLETGRAVFGLPDMVTGLHVRSTSAREALMDEMLAMPDVESVVHMSDAREHAEKSFAATRLVITIAVVVAVMIAVVFLGILSSLDAAERSRDVAILRALGWRDRSVLGLCVTEVTARGYVALLLALPAAPLLATWILERMREANHYRLPLHDPAWTYVLVSLLAAILIPFGAWPALRAARKLPASHLVRLLGSE